MTSQLASQLRKLQVRPEGDRHLNESFLFSKADARSLSREQIHQLATSGLQTLVTIDNRFHPFIADLFDARKTRQERKLLQADESRQLDLKLEHLLTLLSPHLFLTAAQQVFEYLVRVHEVHVYNVQAVLRAFLPYHDHNLFSRAVLLLDLRDSGFDFLAKNQERGAPLLREHLILACAESRTALRLVCVAMAMPVRLGVHHNAANALFASVATALAVHPDAEAHWRVLLPFVVELLHGGAGDAGDAAESAQAQEQMHWWSESAAAGSGAAGMNREAVCTALLILAAWSAETTFSLPMLRTVLRPILGLLRSPAMNSGANTHTFASSLSTSAGIPLGDLLSLIDLLFASQPAAVADVGFAPVVNALVAAPWAHWCGELAETLFPEAARAGAAPLPALLAALTSAALARLRAAHSFASVPAEVLAFVRCAAEQMPLSEALVGRLLRAVMESAEALAATPAATATTAGLGTGAQADGARTAPAPAAAFFDAVTSALERRYQRVFDTTLSQLLTDPATSNVGKGFLERHLGGTRYQMLEVPTATAPGARLERLPLFACLLHTVPAVRRTALAALAEMDGDELCGSRAGAGHRGGSLLELLAHTAAYEADAAVAAQVLTTAAAALGRLCPMLADDSRASHDGERAGATREFLLAALAGLLRALYTMVSGLDAGVQERYLTLVLAPLLQTSLASRTTAAGSSSPAKAAKQGATAAPVDKALRASAVYYATLLYTGAVAQLGEAAGATPGAAGCPSSQADGAALEGLVSAAAAVLLAAFPGTPRTEALLTPTTAALAQAGRRAGARSSSSSSDDSDASDADEERRPTTTRAGKTVTVTSAPSPAGALLAVFDGEALLSGMESVPRERLTAALAAARAVLVDTRATPVEQRRAAVECAVVAAATLSTSPEASAEVLHFLFGDASGAGGEAEKGYLQLLQDAQRASAREAVSGGDVRTAVGRGATNSVLGAAYLPANTLTRALAAAVQSAVRAALRQADPRPAQLTPLLRLLAYLGAPLPTLAEATAALPAPLLNLLDVALTTDVPVTAPSPDAAGQPFGVDWFELVYRAVYGRVGRTTATMAVAVGGGAPVPLGALAACLLLPLRAPAARRVKCLQLLQDVILHSAAAASRPAGAGESSAHVVLAAALAAKPSVSEGLPPVDVTALSSIVEAMSREESRFTVTSTGAVLLSAVLAAIVEGGAAAPYRLAADAVEAFFPLPDGATAEVRRGAATLPLASLLPCVEQVLTLAAGPRPSRRSQRAALSPAGPQEEVSAAAAAFVEAVCRRCVVAGLSPRGATTATAVAQEPSVRLCVLLLQRPYLRVDGGTVRPVHRFALTSLAGALQRGLAAGGQGSLVFKKAAPAGRAGSQGDVGAAVFAEALAALMRPLLVRAVDQIGSDVARLCVGTTGGYQRIFQPFLRACADAVAAGEALTDEAGAAMMAFLEALAPTTSSGVAAPGGPGWLPPTSCATGGSPLTFSDALQVLSLARPPAAVRAEPAGGRQRKKSAAAAGETDRSWPRTPASLQSLQLLAALLRVAPAVLYDDDDDAESLLSLAEQLLTAFPLDQMLPLLRPPTAEEASRVGEAGSLATLDGGSGALLDAFPRHVLGLLRELIALCVDQPHALAEKDPRGPYRLRGVVLKQSLVLMASLLLQDGGAGGAPSQAAAAVSRATVDTIAELLRTLAPLLGPLSTAPAAAGSPRRASAGKVEVAPSSFLLHIPIAALLVRLEPVEFTEALRYRSAADTCREIITSFDVHTQISTITQLMRLVVDPHGQLMGDRSNEEDAGASEDEGAREMREVLHLFRKMVRPNQVVNRQEQLLDVITTAVKSDAFLTPFILLQHSSGGGGSKGGKAVAGGAEGAEEDGDGAEAEQDAAEGTHASDACMRLLLAALEMFSHYSDLNEATANDAASTPDAPFGENKAYAMLLELLSGNTLACVLAGINEPTFVQCQLRLLGDSRTTLQVKGLEVLLDRLHHSLPTVENVLSDEEMEQHRRDLRDPKKKLTLADLVRVKARPLITKRTFQLMTNLVTLLEAARQGALAATKKSAASYCAAVPLPALAQLYRIVQLSIACIEELTRIVASGGSTQAEKTLLNTSRAKRLTEAQLSKLFGNKARVQMVHDYVHQTCEVAMPSLCQCLQALLRSMRKAAGGSDAAGCSNAMSEHDLQTFRATAEEGLLAAMCGLLTSLGTVAQVMGSAFTSAHCIPLLDTVVSAVMWQVADLPPIVARGEAGSLLRHTTLSSLVRIFPACWQLSQPYLARIIFAASHVCNVDDPETSYLCSEVLAVLEALMEPQLFLEAATEGLRGMDYTNAAVLPGARARDVTPAPASRPVRVRATTHSFVLLFACIARRVRNLKREEILLMPVMAEGHTPQDNFWLATLQSLAGSAPTAPTAEQVQPVLDAFTTFFLKFKPKHCTKFLRIIAEWAFDGDANRLSDSTKKGGDGGGQSSRRDEAKDNGDERAGNGESLPRSMLHSRLLFYALYNHLLERLGSILDFSFATALPYIVGTLNAYGSASSGSGGGGGGVPGKQLGPLVTAVLEGALESVRRMAVAQTPGPDYDYSIPLDVYFAMDEVFTALMPAVVRQLTNTTYLTDDLRDYTYRAEHAVIPAVRALFACLAAGKLQAKTQAEILRALRHPSRLVRRAALVCLDGVYADGGEELASRLMAEMLPAVVEMTEDRDEGVVEEARKLCTNLSHMTGQDVLHAMS